METWLFLAMFICVSKVHSNEFLCRKKTSVLGGEQLICHDTDLDFFKRFDMILNKTHWFTCENCTLNPLDNTTFSHVPHNIVAYLYLIQSNIRQIDGDTFKKFKALKSLNLQRNQIESVAPEAFNHLKKLLRLDLSHNAMKSLPNNIFVPLHNLDLLNITYNHITAIESDSFAGLANLKYLYMNHNALEQLEGSIFRHMPNLLLLYLENNRISHIDSFAFANLNQLHALYLNNNSISYLVQYNFKPLKSLINLQLRFNNLSEIQTSSFNGLQHVQFLHLGQNRLTNIKPYGFIGLESLHTLELIGNAFEQFDMNHLKSLDRLSYLWLQENRIANVTIDFGDSLMQSMKSVAFNDNNLTTVNYKLLYHKMPNIRDVFIGNNGWKCGLLVNMFNFFREKEVNVCASDDCNVNRTKEYIEERCTFGRSSENEDTEVQEGTVDEDYVMEEATFSQFSLLLVLCNAVLVLFLSLYNSTSH